MDAAGDPLQTRTRLDFSQLANDTLRVKLSGSWRLQDELPPVTEVLQQQLASGLRISRIAFDTQDLTAWDTGLLTFLRQIIDSATPQQIGIDQAGLPQGVRRLLQLAAAVTEIEGAGRDTQRLSWVAQVGSRALASLQAATEMLGFIGAAFVTFLKFFVGKARYRHADVALLMQECGAQALPIVTLISLLIGLILAFMGAVQLRQFGAQIYVADLVGLGMTREMGAMMAGIIMAGRTGAAFAAQLGTMQVNEEIDALTALGMDVMEFLVLPRMLALVVMMPLLTAYADLMGILGGIVVATGMLDLSIEEYINETRGAVGLIDFLMGLGKGAVYGGLVALAGCLRGIQCGRSAAAVGRAATSAVVTGIVCIIASDGLFAILSEALGI
ncbi:hypothetical protein NKDENANG_00052 [Candidatus Entotheonellaceae bacterium PAL068K]